jgi:nitroimidazol reductase NimA-like FMN-containing flavoprotein (pyridoxamine 5'-phosphate oxidase superfamily)
MNNTDMTSDEREEFLAEVHIGILAIERPGKGPLALPIWYMYVDGAVLISISDDSVKAKLLRQAGRASMTVQVETPPYRYVSVEGPVTLAPPDASIASMAVRYLGPELGKQYAEESASSGGKSVVVHLTPERWLTCDYAKLYS